MVYRILTISFISVALCACGTFPQPGGSASSEPFDPLQPQPATLVPIPALEGSESGQSLLATVSASEVLDHDPRAHAIEIELLELMGRAREQDGLPELRSASELRSLADLRARDMLVRDYFAHQDPVTGFVFAEQWIDEAGFVGAVGELIYTSTVPADLLAQETYLRWMGSASHRAELLRPEFHWIGVSSARNGDWRVVVALFAESEE